MKSIFIILITPLIFISCAKETTEAPLIPQTIIDRSLAYFDGEVIEKKQVEEDGISLWKVKIQNEDGSILEFYWTIGNQVLSKMEGTNGPFDYEIIPGNDLINFSPAKTIAISAVKNSDILQWELEINDDFIGMWVYKFEFQDNQNIIKVYLDALNGNVLQID